MEVTNLLDIHTREELHAWYLENHDKVSDFWLRVNRAMEPFPSVVGYVDAVEVALCFGWIDSTMKCIDDGKPIQHFTPRRKRSGWCWNNIERCRRLIDLGEMTPAKKAPIFGTIIISGSILPSCCCLYVLSNQKGRQVPSG